MLHVRQAKIHDIAWVNACYDEVGFIHSEFDNELIAIAEVDGQKAGLGRCVKLEKDTSELGGIYVLQNFRNNGVARKLVSFLLADATPAHTIYCIPFTNLVPFYAKFGFVPCTDLQKVPPELLKKYTWCKSKYPQPTTLLIR